MFLSILKNFILLFIFLLLFSFAGSYIFSTDQLYADSEKKIEKVENEKVENEKVENEKVENEKVENEEEIEEDDDDEEVEFIKSGFIESENYLSSYKDQKASDANVKNEIRNRFKMKWGTENFYLVSVTNISFIPVFIHDSIGSRYVYSDDAILRRNGMISSKNSEIKFSELYMNYGQSGFRLRLGNQFVAWGTADTINPTSYFNPGDMRELILKDDDESKLSVPLISSMLFLGDYNFELIVVPVHIPSIMPEDNNFWAVQPDDYPFGISYGKSEGMEVDAKNVSYGGRFSGSIKGIDLSLSGYYGVDKDPLYVPDSIKVIENDSIAILFEPNYFIIGTVGVDFSMNFDKFVIQGEVAYTPNKRGYVNQDTTESENITLPYVVLKSHYISYSTGFNYFIPLNKIIEGHEGDTVLTVEWHQVKYFDTRIVSPLFSEMITVRLEDSYLGGRLKLKITGMVEPLKKAYIVWPSFGWDFQNGLTMEISYLGISGVKMDEQIDNSMLYYLKNNDVAVWKVRYDY
jgi:hypothetical protein